VRAAGLLPLYSTWWENAASRAVAAALGAVPYGEDFNLS
jgi:RimJ/RimL family protein N-acetyltransferase